MSECANEHLAGFKRPLFLLYTCSQPHLFVCGFQYSNPNFCWLGWMNLNYSLNGKLVCSHDTHLFIQFTGLRFRKIFWTSVSWCWLNFPTLFSTPINYRFKGNGKKCSQQTTEPKESKYLRHSFLHSVAQFLPQIIHIFLFRGKSAF